VLRHRGCMRLGGCKRRARPAAFSIRLHSRLLTTLVVSPHTQPEVGGADGKGGGGAGILGVG
jgi:hypothetical protein